MKALEYELVIKFLYIEAHQGKIVIVGPEIALVEFFDQYYQLLQRVQINKAQVVKT